IDGVRTRAAVMAFLFKLTTYAKILPLVPKCVFPKKNLLNYQCEVREMEKFNVRLSVSEKYTVSEVAVKTCDFDFGTDMVEHINGFVCTPDVLTLKTMDGYELVRQENIVYVEVLQKEITIYLIDGQLVMRQSLASLEGLLDASKFVRISKSTIINIEKLQRLEIAFSGNYYGFLQNEYKVVISRRYFQTLKEKLNF
ncbi:LytTR family transcriptional regulator, partial [Enterococcus sp. 669A]